MVDKDFFLALDDLEREKGIDKEVFIEALETALVSAYKKQSGISGGVEVKLSPEKNQIRVFSTKNVVEEIVDREKEITVEEAKEETGKTYHVGDVISVEITPKKFGRIACQTAKQVIMQKLREKERENTLSEFSEKEDEMMNCVIRRIDGDNVYVEIGRGQIEGVMMPQDKIPNERYELNERLRVYVKKIRMSGKNAQILVSRSAPGLVKRMFESEVPEIRQGLVVIKSIAREAGQRTKIAIYSDDAHIDAVGACVGNKGARVNAIVSEFGGEKIDIILWSEDPLEFIANALSPAKVIKVMSLDDEKTARVVVPDDKLSLAIGRDGQNVRLAARLTGWKIDVKSESKMLEEELKLREEEEAEMNAQEEVASEIEEAADAAAEIEEVADVAPKIEEVVETENAQTESKE